MMIEPKYRYEWRPPLRHPVHISVCPLCDSDARLKWSGMDCVTPGCGWWYCL